MAVKANEADAFLASLIKAFGMQIKKNTRISQHSYAPKEALIK